MQKVFADNCNKMYQCFSKSLAEIAELNMNTLSNLSKNKEYFEELSHMSKPEDYIKAQVKLAKLGQHEVMTYAKKVGDIWLNAIEEMSEVCQEVSHDVKAKASEAMKSGHKHKE